MGLCSLIFSGITVIVSGIFFLQYVFRDPQYVLNTIFDKGFYWRLTILILSILSLIFNVLGFIIGTERILKTKEEREQTKKKKRQKKILHLTAKIEELKGKDDE